jgi:hypothetical protein
MSKMIAIQAGETDKTYKPAYTLSLILGDQLNPLHSWFSAVDNNVIYVMMELRQEADYMLHHAQKILAIFAGMRDFAAQLKAVGHRVHYVAIDDAANLPSIIDNLNALVAECQANRFEYQAPDEQQDIAFASLVAIVFNEREDAQPARSGGKSRSSGAIRRSALSSSGRFYPANIGLARVCTGVLLGKIEALQVQAASLRGRLDLL